MKWLNWLERRFGKLGINNLIAYIVGITAFVYFLTYIDPSGRFLSRLVLIPSRVFRGEIWRLITYVFIPPRTSLFFIAFVLYFYYMIGKGLENRWGSFKFTLYYLIGYLGTTLAVFITGSVATSFYLNLSLFLAFAMLFPEFEVMVFFILPLKVKYLGILNGLYLGWTLLTAPLAHKITVVMALANFLLFFGQDLYKIFKNRKQVYRNKRKFSSGVSRYQNEPLHRCTICGITELDHPQMEFRYCSKCAGNYEYCSEHLKNHQHITGGPAEP
ncbi:MAG: rhomboid family intramembrane serine protease [Halanaerobiales bacterium]|nr:rhomboid family intramembrane serine protease [Halanaerobiales bacterium]